MGGCESVTGLGLRLATATMPVGTPLNALGGEYPSALVLLLHLAAQDKKPGQTTALHAQLLSGALALGRRSGLAGIVVMTVWPTHALQGRFVRPELRFVHHCATLCAGEVVRQQLQDGRSHGIALLVGRNLDRGDVGANICEARVNVVSISPGESCWRLTTCGPCLVTSMWRNLSKLQSSGTDCQARATVHCPAMPELLLMGFSPAERSGDCLIDMSPEEQASDHNADMWRLAQRAAALPEDALDLCEVEPLRQEEADSTTWIPDELQVRNGLCPCAPETVFPRFLSQVHQGSGASRLASRAAAVDGAISQSAT